MKVSKITRKNYMTPGEHALDLPEQGLVVITGTNGSGKSSWIDSVGSVWNKHVRNPKDRKAHGNLPDVPAKVEVQTYSNLKVRRNWTKGGNASLSWEVVGGHVDTSTTKSKGQSALEAEIGDYKPWRWSCLISSQSTDTFSRATSANRRTILEDVLDLDLLARAHKRIHEETSALRKEVAVKDAELAQKTQQVQMAQQAKRTAEQAYFNLKPPETPPEPSEPMLPPVPQEPQKPVLVLPAAPQPTPPPEAPQMPEMADLVELEARLGAQEQERAVLEEKLNELKAAYGPLQANVQQYQERLAGHKLAYAAAQEKCRLAASGQCPTCEQEIGLGLGSAYQATRDSEKDMVERSEAGLRSAEGARDENVRVGKETRAGADSIDVEILKTKADIDSATRVRQHREQLVAAHQKSVLAHSQQQAQQLAAHDQQCQQLRQQHQERLSQVEHHWQETLRQHSQHVSMLHSQYTKARQDWEQHCAKTQEQYEDTKSLAKRSLDTAKQTARIVEAEKLEMRTELENMSEEYQLRTEALAILGPSGVRAEILDNAMRGVTQEANAVLAELETDVRVHLYAEGKDVGLKTKGGRGPRYEDLSNGEQHRVDFALLRALGRVAAALRGQRDDGTLFIDEALDGIDQNGLDAVCEYLQAVSAGRCVVVITHREEVLSRLRPTKHVEMKDTRIS